MLWLRTPSGPGAWTELEVDCEGFGIETLMNIRAAKAGLKIQEIPSHQRRRIFGSSNLHAIPGRLADPQGDHAGAVQRFSEAVI